MQELQVGERVLSEVGAWLRIESLRDTQTYAVVYNFRVAGAHTYFVGCPEWGFSVWVHNAYHPSNLRKTLKAAGVQEAKYAAHIVPSGDWSHRKVGGKVAQMQKWLNKAGIGTDHAANGFFTDCRRHKGTHTNKFINYAYNQLMTAQANRAKLIEELGKLRAEILTGRFLK